MIPSVIEAAGTKPKIIEEFIGKVNSGSEELSLAKMTSPQGWVEPGQTPAFNEYTYVIKGVLNIETDSKNYEIKAGEAFITYAGDRVRYSTPNPGGAEYIAVCLPAFSPDNVHRDED